MPTVNNGPFVVGPHSPYSGPTPPYYGNPYIPGSEYIASSFTIHSQQREVVCQSQHNGVDAPNKEHSASLPEPQSQRRVMPPASSTNGDHKAAIEEEVDLVEADTSGIESLLNSKTPEKAPKLIRIYNSEDEGNSDEDDASETETERPLQEWPVSDMAKDVQVLCEMPSAKSDVRSEIAYGHRPGKEYSSNSNDHNSERSTKDTLASLSLCRSHSPSRLQKSAQASFQPKKGISVEQYVRRAAVESCHRFNEEALADVIQCSENGRKKNLGMKDETVKVKERTLCREAESRVTSRGCSLSRSCSSQSC